MWHIFQQRENTCRDCRVGYPFPLTSASQSTPEPAASGVWAGCGPLKFALTKHRSCFRRLCRRSVAQHNYWDALPWLLLLTTVACRGGWEEACGDAGAAARRASGPNAAIN